MLTRSLVSVAVVFALLVGWTAMLSAISPPLTPSSIDLPAVVIQKKREPGLLVRVAVAVPPAPANATSVRVTGAVRLTGTTRIENTRAAARDPGTWDVGARLELDGETQTVRAVFDYPPLPGYSCHGPYPDGEFDGLGHAGRTWTVDHLQVVSLLIDEPAVVDLWRRAGADGLHRATLVVRPELDSSGAIFGRNGVWWNGDVELAPTTFTVEYQ